ncbi:hypothetical protein PRIPAC_90675 [Pristionchus pacificus]|uniref:Plus3 domain-containing protein n=1 Tax=Pristionchus pacificus TaxID=54126 RepID=A0A2A6CWT7_PRIPA|nr:hypothetical protein PRIPAC_90675 [Pristionchus pacificus]|eukprot:PDM82517.1 hypothetical protein PRIPAC_36910 [Pristionchus pacificus]
MTSPRLGTMSSDADFSDNDRKKKGKNKSMDSDDSGCDHKSTRRGKGKSSQFVDSDSGSGSEDERAFGKEDSSSDSSSSNSSRSSSPSSRSASRSRCRSAGPNKEDLVAKRPEELKLARLSRFKLARFVHAPFFNKTLIDCYVRIREGKLHGNPNKDTYRIAPVIDVVETAKVYYVASTKTNKGLKLRMGTEERVYRQEYVSNKEFSNQQFQEWMSTMRRHNRSIPTMGEIHKKMKDIASAVEHNYTKDEVNQVIL